MFRLPLLISGFLFSFSTASFAQQIRVEKVKGDKAVVEFSGASLVPGKTYSLSGSSQASSEEGVGGSRAHMFGLNFDMKNLSVSSSVSGGSGKDNSLAATARFGWNLEFFEFGPLVNYQSVSNDSGDASLTSFGGFLDYNIVPNRAGESAIFGVGGEVSFGSYSPAEGISGNRMDVFIPGFLKWFPINSCIGIRTDVGYLYRKNTFASSNTTEQGFGLRVGVFNYF